MGWPGSSRSFLQSLLVCTSLVLFLLPTVLPPSHGGFLTALDWARGSAISEPAGRECSGFSQSRISAH